MENRAKIEIAVTVTPDEEQAARALVVLNWFLKDNPEFEVQIMKAQEPDGAEYKQVNIERKVKENAGSHEGDHEAAGEGSEDR